MLSGKNWVEEKKVIRQIFYRASQIMHFLQTEGVWQPLYALGNQKILMTYFISILTVQWFGMWKLVISQVMLSVGKNKISQE